MPGDFFCTFWSGQLTPQHSRHSCQLAWGQLGRHRPLCGPHLQGCTPASTTEHWSTPLKASHFPRGSRTSSVRWQHSAPAGTTAATEPGRKSVYSSEPNTRRGNQRSNLWRHMSALQRQAASSLRVDLVKGSSWSTWVPTYVSTPAGLFHDTRNMSTTTSGRLMTLPSKAMDGCLSAST